MLAIIYFALAIALAALGYKCRKVDTVISPFTRGLTVSLLLTSLYIYFMQRPRLSLEWEYIGTDQVTGEKKFMRHVFLLSVAGEGTPVYRTTRALLVVPWQFIPSQKPDMSEAALLEWTRTGQKAYQEGTESTPGIPFDINLVAERITSGFPPTALYLYSADPTDDIPVTMKLLVSQDPMDQGILAFVRDVFKYTVTWSGRLPTKRWPRLIGETGKMVTKLF